MEPRRSKHFLAHIPTIALLVVFAMSAPLGVLFFILRAIDRDAEKKEQENAEYSSDFRSQDTGAGQPARDTEPVYGHDVPTAEQQNAKKWHKTLTNLWYCLSVCRRDECGGCHQCVEVLARPRGAVFRYCHGHWRRRCIADRPADEEHPQAGAAAG